MTALESTSTSIPQHHVPATHLAPHAKRHAGLSASSSRRTGCTTTRSTSNTGTACRRRRRRSAAGSAAAVLLVQLDGGDAVHLEDVPHCAAQPHVGGLRVRLHAWWGWKSEVGVGVGGKLVEQTAGAHAGLL